MATKKDNLAHWTNADSFNQILSSRRLLGLTEGRVYLHKGDSSPSSVVGKRYRIVLKEFDGAQLHSALRPPSLWALLKRDQWVTPVGTNIVWDSSNVQKLDKSTVIVSYAQLEPQTGFAKIIGLIRFWGRWLAIDWLFLGLFVLAWYALKYTDNPKFVVGVFAGCVFVLAIAWYRLQDKVKDCVRHQYKD